MRSPRPRLGLYCPGAGTGGPWRYVHSLLAGLDPAEFAVTVFCDLPGGYEPRPWVRVVRLGLAGAFEGGAARPAPAGPNRKRPRLGRLVPAPARVWAGFARETRRLARLMAGHRLDVLHTQNAGCEEAPVAARLAGVPRVIGTFHVDSTYDLHRERSGPTYRALEAVSNRCLDVGIAVSRATGREWVRRTPGIGARVGTIYNGIDPETFRRRAAPAAARCRLGLPEAGPVVGGVGRLDEAKGFGDLVDAAGLLRDEFPDLTVAVAGAGPLRAALEARAAGRVRFLGFQADVQPVLDALDVFALPSWCEACPYALLEAMAAGLPAVGAAVGGVPELIAPGRTGLVVPPRDPAALAGALRALLRDADLRRRWGAAGRDRVAEAFHERDMVAKTIGVYRAGRRPGPGGPR